MKFLVTISSDAGSGWFNANVPQLPGCKCEGTATLDETLHNAREAIDAYCHNFAQEGFHFPVRNALPAYERNASADTSNWRVVEVPVERHWGPLEDISVQLPQKLLQQLDEQVHNGHISNRDDFVQHAIRTALVAHKLDDQRKMQAIFWANGVR